MQIDGLQVTTSFAVKEVTRPEFAVYPNPVRDGSKVNLVVEEPGTYQFVLYNGLGQVAGQHNAYLSPGNVQLDWNALFPSNLSPGVYILKIITPAGLMGTERVIVIN